MRVLFVCMDKKSRPCAGVSVFECSRHKRAVTTPIWDGTVASMDEFEQKYLALVQRITGYPMTEEARRSILDEVEKAYRRARRA